MSKNEPKTYNANEFLAQVSRWEHGDAISSLHVLAYNFAFAGYCTAKAKTALTYNECLAVYQSAKLGIVQIGMNRPAFVNVTGMTKN